MLCLEFSVPLCASKVVLQLAGSPFICGMSRCQREVAMRLLEEKG